ncbi:hypothetical protein [Shewanella aestuarii]|uniref:hypothetical protein n=1 Tax=Shewanella aestuarii TaxID=1028752 RepID=UPI001FCC9AA8|nr:hypothetical protein [Shewanella aestuarii]
MAYQVTQNDFSKINVTIAMISAYVLLMCQSANAVSSLPSREQITDSPSLTSAQISVQLASQLSIQPPQALQQAQSDSTYYLNENSVPTLVFSSELQTANISHVIHPKQQEYNQQLLFEHLQLLALGSDDKKFYRYWQMLNKGSEQQKLEYVDTIAKDIADFWLAHQVRLPYHFQTQSESTLAVSTITDPLASQNVLSDGNVEPIDNYFALEPLLKIIFKLLVTFVV